VRVDQARHQHAAAPVDRRVALGGRPYALDGRAPDEDVRLLRQRLVLAVKDARIPEHSGFCHVPFSDFQVRASRNLSWISNPGNEL
jgi:hypothetical protein